MNDENEGNGTELGWGGGKGRGKERERVLKFLKNNIFFFKVLRIPLGRCGLEKQFSTNPKGYFFRGTAILQFHPNFRTGTDKIWKVKEV